MCTEKKGGEKRERENSKREERTRSCIYVLLYRKKEKGMSCPLLDCVEKLLFFFFLFFSSFSFSCHH